MNKHKIISIILISTMLSETVPIVSAYDNTTVVAENNNTQYVEDIKESLNTDILNNNNIDDNSDDVNDSIKNIENLEGLKDSKLEDLDGDINNSDRNDNDSAVLSLDNENAENDMNMKSPSESIEKLDAKDTLGSVLEITLADGEFVPDLTGNPDGYDTIRVTTIGNKKLVSRDYNNLRKSLIPNIDLSNSTSDSIPAGAFASAKHLTSFQFPQGVESIDSGSNYGMGAFYNCTNLKGTLVIPDSVTTIGDYAFWGCKGFTGKLVIPNSVEYIGVSAFNDCIGFTGDLVIPNSVTFIGNDAFRSCSGFSGNLVIPNSVTSIGDYTFANCSGFTGNLIIPNSVTSIGKWAFRKCNGFTGDLVIPNSVTTIGYSAFYECSGFTGNLIISNSVEYIDEYAFFGCKGFTGNLIISNSVKNIYRYTFADCSGFTGDLIIPNSVTSIDISAFRNCSGFTGDLIIPDSITAIGTGVFDGCSGFSGNLVIPNSVTSIGNEAFRNCSRFTGDLIIPNSVTSVGYSAFNNCRRFTGDLIIPDSITAIGTGVFDGCSGFSGNLVIPNSVTSIGNEAFRNCSRFTGDLIIPNSVTSVGYSAFNNCRRFTGDLIIPDSITAIGSSVFDGCSGFSGNLVIPNSVTSIGNYAFRGCSGFTGDLIIPDSIITIGVDAFRNCSGVQNFIFRVNESFEDVNYKKDIFDKLNVYKTIIEMSYDFDLTGTWLNNLNVENIGKPIIQSEVQMIEGKSSLMSLYIPTPYKEENISILKDGEVYSLPTKTTDKKYMFNEEGKYNITLTTDLGTVSNIEFEVAVVMNKPTITYETNLISIIDNGSNLGTPGRIEYRLNGGEWRVYAGSFRIPDEFVNGVDDVYIEARVVTGNHVSNISDSKLTVLKAQIDAIDVEITQGDDLDELDYVTATDIDGSDISDKVTVVSSDVKFDTPGEYNVVYRVEASNGYFTEKEIKVTVLKKKLPPIIIAKDVVLEKGEKFDPLDFITVTDSDGRDIDKSNVEIIENTVNLWEPGDYKITFKIIDDNGLETTKTIVVTIKKPKVDNENNTDGGGNQNNNNNANNTINKDTIPSTGGVAPLLNLTSIISIIGGYCFMNKRNKR